jgi:hypothetical protein
VKQTHINENNKRMLQFLGEEKVFFPLTHLETLIEEK